MFRIDDATAASSLPVPEAPGPEGYFTEGNPAGGTPATNVRGSWLNMIQEELCAILAAAGIARSKTSYNQVNTALQKMYSPVVGSSRNLAMSVAAASATATLTADEIVVGTELGGQKYVLPSFNKTINLATTGAGGMDTGTAPISGFVALYAIYNPTTQTSALLATNATSAVQPNVYGGGNMPSGYTASALLSVWATNASSQFIVGGLHDRYHFFAPRQFLNTSTVNGSLTSTPCTVIPKNAVRTTIAAQTASSVTTGMNLIIAADASGTGQKVTGGYSQPGTGIPGNFDLDVLTPQTVFTQMAIASGTLTSTASAVGYWI
ncbi:hypothetical protein DR64_724 [Paraburkholderia xenovorans LB400]|uniref:Phage tail protein n=1 Tax=Paraburkholderia xenovorans (strain LB400) TaxID=266265 RepID=Q141Q4_PARXL|nr:hypothetical protein [Paraburkholderia xenovorans]ABE29935.1 hypothetical protein Bxe_A3044 [Paraburkholderia xenovorans LB400]AIP31320.1 hypothetical protein DR64_724 [Paraburkholderia xenovorans LB400]